MHDGPQDRRHDGVHDEWPDGRLPAQQVPGDIHVHVHVHIHATATAIDIAMSRRPSRRLFDALGADRPSGAVRRAAAWVVAVAALAAVFASYLNPHMAVDIANRVWACF